jgi:hypothetical protein
MRLCALGLFLDVQLVDPLLSLRLQGPVPGAEPSPRPSMRRVLFPCFKRKRKFYQGDGWLAAQVWAMLARVAPLS